MLENFYSEYGNVKKEHSIIETPEIEKLKSLLPVEILDLLDRGCGSYMNGYFWIVNPFDYEKIKDEIYLPVTNPSICFARDAFGGLFCWEDNSIIYVNIRKGTSKVAGRKPSIFFNNILTDWEYFSGELNLKNYLPALKQLGELAFDECYGYVPLLGLGGSEKVENLQKVKIKEYISIVSQALGKIE